MIPAFTSVLHVPNLSKPEEVLAVLDEYDIFDKQDLKTLAKRMNGHKYALIFRQFNFFLIILLDSMSLYFNSSIRRVFIGIKKLLDLIDMARQTEKNYRIIKFLTKLEEEGGLVPTK